MVFRTSLAITAVLLVGCMQTEPFVRPELPVPDNWGASVVIPGEMARRTHWRTFFTDPQLKALIEVALANNRDLRVAAGRVQEARAQFGLVRADGSPSLNLLGSGNLTRTSSDLSGVGAPLTSQRFDLGVSSLSFELDFWGRIANLTEAARQSYLATQEAQRSVNLSLIADVALTYLSWLQFDEMLVGERDTVLLRDASVKLAKKGFEAGVANDFEYQQALAQLESARGSLANMEYQQGLAQSRLSFLLGNAAFELKPGGRIEQQGLDIALEAGLPSDVLLLRPDVLAAEKRLIATNANVAAARAAFLPRISLTAGMGLASQGLLKLFTGGAWSFLPTISLPLFDGGRTAAGLDLAQARKVIAVAEYERAIQVAFREVADSLALRVSLERQSLAVAANLQAQSRRLEIAVGRFQTGVSGYLEVLEAQRDVISARQTVVQIRRAQLESAVQLYKALGGGADGVV